MTLKKRNKINSYWMNPGKMQQDLDIIDQRISKLGEGGKVKIDFTNYFINEFENINIKNGSPVHLGSDQRKNLKYLIYSVLLEYDSFE
jgi:hypothetical protein